MTDEEITIALGKNVGSGKPLLCPVCSSESIDGEQPMSSFGNMENILFCPHCDLNIELKVIN